MSTVLITGAASGIGAACAERFAARGHRVIGVDTDKAALDRCEAVEVGHGCDVSDAESVRAIPGIAGVDILVQSAGVVGPNTDLVAVDSADWQRTFAVNVTGVFNMMQAVIPSMVERGFGRIVNVASIAGKEGNPRLGAYSASKAAVIGLTKSVAKELASTGVLVHSVAPAVIATPMNADTAPEVLDYMVTKIPMGRVGEPEEVAALIEWLSSKSCSFTTGACHDISGGRATY